MRRPLRFSLGLALTALALAAALPARGQSGDACAIYFDAATPRTPGSVPVIPEKLLGETNALPCLVRLVSSLKGTVTSAQLNTEATGRLLSATGAIRSMIARATAIDEKTGKDDNLKDLIKRFRELDNLDTVSVLSYGARSNVYDVRLNSVLILGNVIDNTTVCVPLTHLYDAEIETAQGANGRANLLGVVSVVAPWALKENFESIDNTRDFLAGRLNLNDPNLRTTRQILENIKLRLDAQSDDSNKGESMPPSLKSSCKGYIQSYPGKLIATDKLRY